MIVKGAGIEVQGRGWVRGWGALSAGGCVVEKTKRAAIKITRGEIVSAAKIVSREF